MTPALLTRMETEVSRARTPSENAVMEAGDVRSISPPPLQECRLPPPWPGRGPEQAR